MIRKSTNPGHAGRIIVGLILVLFLASVLTACGSARKYAADTSAVQYSESSKAVNSMAPQEAPMPYPAKEDDAYGEAGFGGDQGSTANITELSNNIMSQRKVIMDSNVTIETLHFDDSIAALDQLVNDFGGFAEVRNVRGKSKYSRSLRTASYVIRIPAENFDLVMKNMGTIGNVLESTSKGTDITDTYYDTQTRIKTLKVQEETLLDILSKAEKLEDVITLEKRISEVRYEIESLENTIKNYDRLVAFSRITIFIQEVDDDTKTEPDPKTLGERISGSFKKSLEDFKDGFEDFLVWLVGSWISIVFVVLAVVILVMVYKSKKRKAERKANNSAVEKTADVTSEKKE